MSTLTATIQLRSDTAANWTSANPVLLSTELGIETDTYTTSGTTRLYNCKLGDGSTAWNSLAYVNIGQFFAGGTSSELSQLDYTPQAAPAYKRGRTWYDSSDEALSYYDDITGTSLQIGQENVIRCRNNTGSTITNMQAVYISGATGQNPTIALAKADAESTSVMIGLATHDIANNTIGKVTVLGMVKDVNTSSWSDGDILFLSPTTAGLLTNTPPSTPNFSVPVGFVAHSHVTQGKILVRTEMPLATNTALGTSNRVAPSQGAVYANITKSMIQITSAGFNPADNSYYYFRINAGTPISSGVAIVPAVRFKAVANTTSFRVDGYISNTTAGSSEAITMKLFNNTLGTNTTITSTLTADAVFNSFTFTGDFTINAGNEIYIEMLTPTWPTTNPTGFIPQLNLMLK